jgi:hypothetical protein
MSEDRQHRLDYAVPSGEPTRFRLRLWLPLLLLTAAMLLTGALMVRVRMERQAQAHAKAAIAARAAIQRQQARRVYLEQQAQTTGPTTKTE